MKDDLLNQGVLERLDAGWVSRTGIPGEQQCLAAATSMVNAFAVTRPAGLLHPLLTSKVLEGI